MRCAWTAALVPTTITAWAREIGLFISRAEDGGSWGGSYHEGRPWEAPFQFPLTNCPWSTPSYIDSDTVRCIYYVVILEGIPTRASGILHNPPLAACNVHHNACSFGGAIAAHWRVPIAVLLFECRVRARLHI